MSTLEKKALAFEKLAALQDERVIDEILAHLEKLNEGVSRTFNLSKHMDSIGEQYNDTLQKLAQ